MSFPVIFGIAFGEVVVVAVIIRVTVSCVNRKKIQILVLLKNQK